MTNTAPAHVLATIKMGGPTRHASGAENGTITREEYYRRTEHADRPLTQSATIGRRHGVVGQLLAGEVVR